MNLAKSRSADSLAQGLGWFSIGLGVAQIVAPRRVARMIGVNDSDRNKAVMRAVGVREIAAGIGLLSDQKPTGFAVARVAGDLMDLAMLSNALRSPVNDRGKTTLATAAVIGIGALDVLCSEQLATTVPKVTHPAKQSGSMHIRKSVTIARPIEEVYSFWRNFENLPQFMQHLDNVRTTDDTRSHWTAKPLGGSGDGNAKAIEWDVEIIEDRENELIAWRTVGISELSGRGTVEFRVAPGGRGAEVHADMQFDPPGGPVGAKLARLFRDVPGIKLENNLNLLKQILETGEIVRSDASVHTGPHPGQPPGTRQSGGRAARR
ncbi:MAG TPA: SRPBCC family protein [Gemmatimonadaceae bacterium]